MGLAMAKLTDGEKNLRSLKDVKRDIQNTVKDSKKYTFKEKEEKAKLYKELTDMGGKSKYASYWKKFLPKQFHLKKQKESINLKGVQPEIRKKLISDMKIWNKNNPSKKIPFLTVSSGYRSKELNDSLIEKEVKRSIDYIGDATEEEKKIIKNAIWRKDSQGNAVKGKQRFLNQIRSLNISQDRKRKLEKAIGSEGRGRNRVTPTSTHQTGMKMDLAKGQLTPEVKKYLSNEGWKLWESAGRGGLVDLSLDPSKEGSIKAISKLVGRKAMEEAMAKKYRISERQTPDSVAQSLATSFQKPKQESNEDKYRRMG